MNNSTNRLDILKLVESGQLSASEAAARLAGLDQAPPAPARPPSPPASERLAPPAPASKGRTLHVQVTDLETGQPHVAVRVPMSLVRLGLNIGARFAPQVEEPDWNAIGDALDNDVVGQIVEVMDADDGKRIQVFVE